MSRFSRIGNLFSATYVASHNAFPGRNTAFSRRSFPFSLSLKSCVIVLALFLVPGLLLSSTPAEGQAISVNGGSIQGTITDASGAVINGATVTISNKDTGYSKTLKTDNSGFYSVGPLNPGNYTIGIQAPGFLTVAVQTVVRTGTATSGNYKLQVGQSSEQIVVSAGAVQVNTEQSAVSYVITREQIDSLPVNGRNFLDVAQLEPGVVLQSGESFDPTKAGYSALSMGGVSGRTTRILLDGQDVTDENVGTTIFNVSQGSIDEFQINRSTQDVSGELTSTGQVLVATRSGTNSYHGQLFYNFQDHSVGFARDKGGIDAPFQRNQFGGRFGGKILKDKLFFFGSSERIKQDSSTAAGLGSRFSQLNGQFPTIATPFRETYSAGRLDWNGPFGGHYFVRLNYDVNSTWSNYYGYGYWLYANRDNTPGLAGGADFSTGSFTHSFRLSYEKFHNLISDRTSGNSAIYYPIHGLAMSNASENFATGPNPLAPQETYQSDKQFRYDGSWTHGAHNVRYGVSLNRLLGGGYASFYGLAPRAYFTDKGLVSGGQMGNPLDYHPSRVRMGNGQGFFSEKSGFGYKAGGQEDWRFAFYIADAWKVRPDLTINVGLRYSRDTQRANQDLASIPCSDINTSTFSTPPCTGSSPLLEAFGPGLGKRVNQPNANFGPQVGLAYQIGGSAKTVFRAGFGVYYDSNVWNNILFDREDRLRSGLFNNVVDHICDQITNVPFPGGTSVSSVGGQSIATLCGEPLSISGPYFVQLQQMYQQAVAAAGTSGNVNPDYVGETLRVNNAFYAPKYVSPYSLQYNFGIQQELFSGAVFTVDYVHSSTLKMQQTIDVNRVGAARYFNATAARNAVSRALADLGASSVQDAIDNHQATIDDFAAEGLDSGINFLSGYPAAYAGSDPNTQGAAFPGANAALGEALFNFPSGRAAYDALQLNLRVQKHLSSWVPKSNLEVSYGFSRIITTSQGGSDAFFTTYPWNYDDPTKYMGYANLDQTHALSFGGFFTLKYGPQLGLIAHFRSAPPTSLVLDTSSAAYVFQTDVDGDGSTGDLLPGTSPGAYMRDVGGKGIKTRIDQYNAKYANTLTPAGQAVVSAGIMTAAQMQAIGAVQQPIAQVPGTSAYENPMFKSIDLNLGYPVRWKKLGDNFSLEPTIAFYNVGNFGNYAAIVGGDAVSTSGMLLNTSNGPQDNYLNGRSGYAIRNLNRTQRGSGTFSQGSPRSMEFQLRLNF